ncbi:MAG: 16S rRNA (guanine(527)-N(7))-methyltransferase RsmG [Spirochaetales bacterium]|nr:16S rRNA (guanine(527)-N(7))-methyltransferase RsmG [Spirochaetales bacterium]
MLEAGLAELKIVPTDIQRERLNAYIEELLVWNSKLNLVSASDREELIVRHILDCLSGLEIIRNMGGSSIADIGTGAGLPGMLLAIFLEKRTVSLVERSGRKAGFLRSTSALLGLVDRVEVLDVDLKQVDGVFDIVTLRAFRDLGDFISPLRKITAPGGRIAAYKGRMEVIEKDLKAACIKMSDAEIIGLKVPFLEEERNLLIIN